jgi:hypothetical protein
LKLQSCRGAEQRETQEADPGLLYDDRCVAKYFAVNEKVQERLQK